MFRYKQSWSLTTVLVIVWVIIPVSYGSIFADVVEVIYSGNWNVLEETRMIRLLLTCKKDMQDTYMAWKLRLFWTLDLGQRNFLYSFLTASFRFWYLYLFWYEYLLDKIE